MIDFKGAREWNGKIFVNEGLSQVFEVVSCGE